MIFRKTSHRLLLALLLFIQVFKAQVTITIPTNNLHSTGLQPTDWRKPFGTYFGFERSAMIYDHSEIGQFGNITNISFYCDTINLPGNAPIAVYMKEVTNPFFTVTTYVSQEESGAQLVYTGTIPSTSFVKGQWINIPLTNPFLHANAKPVEIIIETNATGTGNEGILAKGFYHYLTSSPAFERWSADNTAPSNLGTLSSERPNIQLGVTPVAACSGQPAGGTAVASVDTTCSAVTLSLNGYTNATGLTFQWQDSLASGAWNNIAGGTSAILAGNIHADTWFRCKVSCGTQFSYSSVKEVVMANYMQCYCNANLGGGCSGSAIDSVALAGTGLVTSHTGCSANNYTLYPAAPGTCAQVVPGQTYSLHTRFTGNVISSVWIDYDQSGSFDSTEWKQITGTAQADTDYAVSLTVPFTAKNGLTLMRIRSRSAGNINGYANACTNFGSGETEDYFIGINYDVHVSSPSQEAKLVLYPNPADQTLWIAGNLRKSELLRIELYSMNGTLEKEIDAAFNGDPLLINVSDLAPGAHFVRVTGSTVNMVKKFVVQR